MVKLPEVLKRNGYTLKLITRSSQKAIYAQMDGDHCLAYEVIKIRVHKKAFNRYFNRIEPERESYPNSSSWGDLGWTLKNWEDALMKYNQLV